MQKVLPWEPERFHTIIPFLILTAYTRRYVPALLLLITKEIVN